MKFQYKFKLDEQDYYEFNRYHMDNAPQMKKQLRFLRFLFPVLIMLIGVFLHFTLEISPVSYIIWGVFAVSWIVFFKRIANYSLKINMKKLKKDGKLVYDKDVAICFYDENFTEKSVESESTFKYSMIEKIGVSHAGIYLYMGALLAHIIPKSVFESEAEFDELVAFINSKVNKG